MRKTRLILGLAAAAGFALAQTQDAPGVQVDVHGATLMHRSGVEYPGPARVKGAKGAVAAEVTLDAAGNVVDARVLSGPEEFRKAVLQSVLAWHFAPEASGARHQVTVTFDAPAAVPTARQAFPEVDAVRRGLLEQRPPQVIQSIQVAGLSDALRADLLSRTGLRQGDNLTADSASRAMRAIAEFDEHMSFSARSSGDGVAIVIGTPDARATVARTSSIQDAPGRIRVGGNVQQSRLIQQAKPVYPPLAKQARIQGVVKLDALIGRDGTVKQLDVVSGHPLLVAAALEAVKQWMYEKTLLNGAPVEVVTQIDVNFTLSQ
jgi:TonB family protein